MGNRFGNKDITVRGDRYIATDGIALQAWMNGEPYATITICVEGIPLKENEIILNHDILWDEEFVKEFLEYMCDSSYISRVVSYGMATSLKVKLKDNWRELCTVD